MEWLIELALAAAGNIRLPAGDTVKASGEASS
ncbi:hypothetical protein FOCG_06598 [Fusarium oxysporum f. sp. radicis-lycopersici 26381]|uniref:Uncharacterized protein n=2 Tax=Fusarium oxysporum TaxID=5507 RepID=W9JAF2_FUSOX|nr:hypothetical protein FOYG_01323 [Fusarium oxysporum NRRL 32931]EXK45224.1 hypothetical protein FOMG_03734 [Fusarium oxysporum f. sp. melonis 26406]EXL53235.1 hypothetical protein FOCG_06598 [Fusarium oxysporum f. sp. radicis-lycopersici 26381]